MSPAAKKAMLPIGVLISTALGVATWAIRSGAQVVDHRYVHVVRYDSDQTKYEKARIIDSLVHEARDARIDAALKSLVSACRQQGACKP